MKRDGYPEAASSMNKTIQFAVLCVHNAFKVQSADLSDTQRVSERTEINGNLSPTHIPLFLLILSFRPVDWQLRVVYYNAFIFINIINTNLRVIRILYYIMCMYHIVPPL